ncbi:MAG: helix-turn-helix transcriptional regulator [Clostridia bacterium]|nr:helix-turn-helix transcriptional regulator [Clostridia bacterium]
MDESICRFMPAKGYTGNIKTIHFVYETEFQKLKQPFLHAIWYAHLVTSGTATLKMNNRDYALTAGTLFFTFPAIPCEIEGSADFKYFYVSFMGSGAGPLLEQTEITPTSPVYPEFGHLIDFWTRSIVRVNQQNANLLAESVLLHTLSYVNGSHNVTPLKDNRENLFEMIVDYIDNHYEDHDLSLKKLSDIFSYTEKYLSRLFHSKMNTHFSAYVTNLRIQRAHGLIEKNMTSITQISSLCGFDDPLYFSKVFKRCVGYSPSDYIKQKNKINGADA